MAHACGPVVPFSISISQDDDDAQARRLRPALVAQVLRFDLLLHLALLFV